MTITKPQLLTRSANSDWNHDRWACLPDDGNRYEVVDGVLYMSTAPRAYHQWVIKRLLFLVGGPAEEQGIAYAYFAPIGVFMPGCDPVQPDFLLIRQERITIIDDGQVRGVPDLIAEVLSPSNPELDTSIKRSIYARAGVPEYWIVRPTTGDVLVCWQPDTERGDYARTQLLSSNEQLTSPTLAIRVDIVDLFSGSPENAR